MSSFAKILAVVLLASNVGNAQGLRVSQFIYDASRLDESGNEPLLSSSFTLFHNGRVYDYVEAAGEVVRFEPVAKRFTVINPRRGVYTTVPFDEVTSILKARGPESQTYIKELLSQKSPQAERAARMLNFQLNPKFDSKYTERTGMLQLSAPSWKYFVTTREWDDTEQLQQYLTYTDWMARLNCVLHPHSMFPEPRLALNDQLRELKNRIPVYVQLDLRPDERMILRAEHKFVRNLTDHDRTLINDWDNALKSGELRNVPLRKYQEAVLVSGN